MREALMRPLSLGGTWLGVAGCFLMALGATSGSFSHNPNGWPWPPMRSLGLLIDRPLANWLIFIGALVLFLAWWWLRPRPGRIVPPPGPLLVLWAIPLLIVPPLMSADPFLYADLGWILHSGGNPYLIGLAGMGGPYAPSVDLFWAGNGVAYPPLALEASRLGVELMGLHPYFGVIGQRLLAISGVAVLVALLPRLGAFVGVPRGWTVWFGLLNPILVVHFLGGAHNDALMAGVVVFALWVSTRSLPYLSPSLVLAPILVGIAMAFKQQAGLAVVATAGLAIAGELRRLPFWQRITVLGWRSLWSAVLALATFVGVSVATGLNFGWTEWMSQMGRTGSFAPSFVLGQVGSTLIRVLTGADGAWFPRVAYLIVVALCLIGLAWLLLAQAAEPMTVLGWGSLLVAFMGQALHPWYLVLTLALLGVVRLSERQAGLVVYTVLGYSMAYQLMFTFQFYQLISGPLGVLFGVGFALMHRLLDADAPFILAEPCDRLVTGEAGQRPA